LHYKIRYIKKPLRSIKLEKEKLESKDQIELIFKK